MKSHGTAGWGSFGGYYYFSTYTGFATGDFGVGAAPTSGAVMPGGAAAFVINTWTVQGAAQTLTFGTGGLPAGISASWSIGSVSSGGQSTLTLNVGTGTTPGGYTVTASAQNGLGVTHSISLGLTVNPPPGTGEPAICLTPSSLGFSDQMVGTVSPSQTVTLKNCGSGLLHITSGGASPEFSLGGISLPLDLAAGFTTTFQAGFSPLGPGAKTGSVKIFSNAIGSPAVLTLSGNATPAPVTTGTVVINGTFNGTEHLGYIGVYQVTWPSGGSMLYSDVPQTLTAQTAGPYTLTFLGPPSGGGTFSSITPSTSQTLAASDVVTFTINLTGANSYALWSYDPPLPIPVGSSGSLSLTAAYSAGGTQNINLAASGLPPGATVSFNPQPMVLTGGQVSTTATIVTTSTTPPGIFNVTFTATNQDGLARTVVKQLAVVTPGAVQMVSVGGAPAPSGGGGDQPSVSADGRYVSYLSTNPFVRDRINGTTTQVNVAYDGSLPVPSSTYLPSISANGRFVVFNSDAGNLVAGVPGGVNRLYVRDLQLNSTLSVGVASDGTPANDYTLPGSLSGDGRLVAFGSPATNLVLGAGGGQVYVRDIEHGTTSIVSVSNDGAPGNATSDYPKFSADGTTVAFFSSASNLIPGVSGTQVYVRSFASGTTELVSVAADGSPANGWIYDTYGPQLAITPDGRFVAFVSSAPNLGAANYSFVVVRDRKLKTTTLASLTNDGAPLNSHDVSLSADGRFVAFSTVFGDYVQVALRDMLLGQTRIVSLAPNATLGSGSSVWTALSADGRTFVFASNATNLVAGDTNAARDVFAAALPALSGQALKSLTMSPASVTGGSVIQGVLTLTGAAPAGGATVLLTSSDAAAQVPSSVTIPGGSATANFFVPTLQVGTKKTITVVASYGGGSPWTAVSLLPSAPARIDIVQGDGQAATGGSAFVAPLKARVLDAANNPLTGVAVLFSAPASGPSGSFPGSASSVPVLTDLQGVATAPSLKANGSAGHFAVLASVDGVSLPAVFSLTNLAVRGSSFNTLTPCRILDTRITLNGITGPAPLQTLETRSLNVGGICGVPADAVSISVNLTVTNVGAAGELIVFPADVTQPNTSAMSFKAGRTRANNAFVKLSTTSPTFSVFNNSASTVDFIVDVNGYFR
jgi:Tol biopolymer transport system component